MVLNIWFNRWFSTVSHYMELIRHNPDQQEFVIYGTHPNPDTVYFNYCDVFSTEPDIVGEDYLQFCIDYCLQNQIHIFVPRKENVLISKHLDKFNKIGVKVLVCPDGDLMAMIDDKAAMYRSLQDQEKVGNFIVTIPSYRIVNNAAGFQQAYADLGKDDTKLCIKPVIGEGASGFRIIDDIADTIPFIYNTTSTQKISYDTAYKILKTQEHFSDLMVIEYLDGHEYSIDCLANADGTLLVAIPRKKGNGRIREIEYNRQLIEIAEKMAAQYKFPYVYNIQVKYKDGIPKLLEINPRMSGGMHISCLADINIPYYAIKLLLNGHVEALLPKFGVRATHIEQPVILPSKESAILA